MEWKSVYFSLGILLARHLFQKKKMPKLTESKWWWSGSLKYTFQRDKNLMSQEKRQSY